MEEKQKAEFAQLIASIADIYQFRLSAGALEWYWMALQKCEIEALKKAIALHISDIDRGKWMPRPADILFFYVEKQCSLCNQIGVIVRDGEEILPWSLEREVNQGLKPEVCPECHGKNRVNTPGLPDMKFE